MKIQRISLAIFCLLLLVVSLTHAQEKLRTVEQGKYRKYDISTEPIAVVSRELGNKPFIDDAKVVGSSDWLRHLTLGIKNISNKTIKEFHVHLVIPKQGNLEHDWVMIMMFPSSSETSRLNKNTDQETAKILKPGATVKLTISENQLRILDVIKEYGVTDVEGVSLRFDKVSFSDGTRWYQGVEMKEDPSQPGRYVPIRSDISDGTHLFSKWFSPFALINAVGWPIEQLVINLPAKCRSSFGFGSNMVSAQPPTPGCGWLTGTYPTLCATAAEGNCTATLGTCWYDKDWIAQNDPGFGTFGQVVTEGGFWCLPDAGQPGDACNPDVGGCQSFLKQKWYSYPTCGQPQGCALTATWGCISPLVDVNGVCQRSVEYQNACATGYNSLACECNPPSPGGCYRGMDIEGKMIKEGDPPSQQRCSACNPEPWELSDCYSIGGNYDWTFCQCVGGNSPIVVDVLGNGFNLTNAESGVQFDLDGNGVLEQYSWSSAGSDDAWLALDRNSNGMIDSGRELFGNFTNQPTPPAGTAKNGFLALAVYDLPENGGNSDGFINRRDDVFESLRLWQDVNHNGVSESNELFTLPQLGLRKIELDYRESRRTDEHGNRFKYRARVRDAQDAQLGRWAWDVYLLKHTPPPE